MHFDAIPDRKPQGGGESGWTPAARRVVTTPGQNNRHRGVCGGHPRKMMTTDPAKSGAATEQDRPEVVLPTGFEPALPP